MHDQAIVDRSAEHSGEPSAGRSASRREALLRLHRNLADTERNMQELLHARPPTSARTEARLGAVS